MLAEELVDSKVIESVQPSVEKLREIVPASKPKEAGQQQKKVERSSFELPKVTLSAWGKASNSDLWGGP